MPDVLSHALIGYALGTVLSVQYSWIDRRWVTVVMLGAILPDLDKVHLLIGDSSLQQLLGMPFSWLALHLPAGTLVVCALLALIAGDRYRCPVFGLLLLGAMTHYALDILAVFTTGYSYPLLWPLWWQYFPAADLYQSSDRWPLVVSAIVATLAFLLAKVTGDPEVVCSDTTTNEP